jgi:hypothetical protein
MLPVGHDVGHPHPASPLPSTIEYRIDPPIKAPDRCRSRVPAQRRSTVDNDPRVATKKLIFFLMVQAELFLRA